MSVAACCMVCKSRMPRLPSKTSNLGLDASIPWNQMQTRQIPGNLDEPFYPLMLLNCIRLYVCVCVYEIYRLTKYSVTCMLVRD